MTKAKPTVAIDEDGNVFPSTTLDQWELIDLLRRIQAETKGKISWALEVRIEETLTDLGVSP